MSEVTGVSVKMGARGLLERLVAWGPGAYGEPHGAALMRVGLAAIVWARFAAEVTPWATGHWEERVGGVVLLVGSLSLFFGFFSRVSALMTGAALVWLSFYVTHVLGRGDWMHHHIQLLTVSTLLLSLTPCGNVFSVDRYLAVRRAERGGGEVAATAGPLWGVRLIALQVAAVYFWGAVDKTNLAFLSGARMEHYAMMQYFGADYPPNGWVPWLIQGFAVGSVVLEYVIVPGLFVRRWRLPLVIVGIAFHAGVYFLLPVKTFSVTICLLYLAFFEADEVAAVFRKVAG